MRVSEAGGGGEVGAVHIHSLSWWRSSWQPCSFYPWPTWDTHSWRPLAPNSGFKSQIQGGDAALCSRSPDLSFQVIPLACFPEKWWPFQNLSTFYRSAYVVFPPAVKTFESTQEPPFSGEALQIVLYNIGWLGTVERCDIIITHWGIPFWDVFGVLAAKKRGCI